MRNHDPLKTTKRTVLATVAVVAIAAIGSPQQQRGIGACLVRNDATSIPNASAPDVGKGYARKILTGTHDATELRELCTQPIYEEVIQAYLKGGNTAPVDREVALYGDAYGEKGICLVSGGSKFGSSRIAAAASTGVWAEESIRPAKPAEPVKARDRSLLNMSSSHGDIALMIIDQDGKRVGVDSTGNKYGEILRSGVELDSMDDDKTGKPADPSEETQITDIEAPVKGVFALVIFGRKDGHYAVSIRAFSKDGPGQLPVTITGTIKKGETVRKKILFDPAPGSQIIQLP